MKKFTKVSMATALVASALVPVAASAAETDQAPAGFYNIKTGEVVKANAFTFLSPTKKLEILMNADKEYYFLDGSGKALDPSVLLTAKTNEDVDSAKEDKTVVEERHDVKFTEDGKVETPAPVETVVESVMAINGTVTVTFDKDVTEVPEGLSVKKDGEALELSADAFSVVDGKIAITVPKVEAPEEGVTEVTYAVTLGETTKEVTLKVTAMTELEPTQEEKALQAAEAAVSAFEAKVSTAELAEELVTDRDKREEVAASFTPAANKIQEVKGEQKQALLDRLDAANDVVIAAGSVSSLQAATADLTEDTLADAKSQLTKTQNLLNHVAEGTVKDALQALVTAESDKIDALQADLDEAAKIAQAIADAEAAIADLPETITLADKQDVADARALVEAALALDENAAIANLDTLVAAEEAIEQLEADEEAAAQLAAAKTAAEEAITDLPTVEELTLDDEAAVEAARELVSAFTDLGGTDTDVENLATLEVLEDQLDVLKAEAELDAAVSAAQEAVDALTLASATNVDSQEKVDAATALVKPAKDAIAAVTALNAEADVTALNNAVATAIENIAKAEAVLTAKALVVTAQETLLDTDFTAAQEAVTALPNSDAKTLENAKLIELQETRTAILAAVKSEGNNVELFKALQAAPFEGALSENIAGYKADLAKLEGGQPASLTEVQNVIDAVNESAAKASLAEKVETANNKVATITHYATTTSELQTAFEESVAAAQEAIDALPADYKVNEEDEQPLVATLQAKVDTQVQLNTEYVNNVTPINAAAEAGNEINLNTQLNAAAIENLITGNVDEYVTAISGSEFTTLEEIQNVVDIVNAKVLVEGLTTTDADSGLTALAKGVGQDEISAAKALVEALPDTVNAETGEATPGDVEVGLLEDIAAAQAFVDALNIKDQAGLKAALENVNIVNLKLVESFETTEKINVTRAVSIDGGNNTITFKGDATGWNSNFVLQVYNTGEGTTTISNLKLTGADGGLLVNGAKVVLSGTIDVSGNEFGGIESGKGSDVETNPSLDVTNATLVNTTEAYGLPTVWEDGVTETVVGFEGTEITKGSQPQYYLVEENSIDPLPAQQEAAVTAAEEAIANLPTVEDLTLEDTVAVEAARALVIEAIDLNESAEIEGVDKLEALEAQLPILAEQDKVADILAAESAAELQPLLVNLNQGVYNNLTSVQRLEVANLFLDTLAEDTFESLQSISEALVIEVGVKASDDTNATGYFALLAVVNEATSITDTRDALAELGNETFGTMSASEKLVASENVLNAKPETGYSSIAQIANNFTAQ
ncbi:pectate lyase-like adhesive domain-containing protein [Sporosarcina ureae]|uniref:Uncharacterized protein n=1 Tax=Sporosarcina ureae TaxID=1571 RepID=A0ABN4YVD9_SPOUR|nr:pectate lyase-like adhesive domain-containing protein [Sporosarcina ureae]ARF14895.1 hypothetical protein SporoS204_12470 [Sporosarcina ureae]